MGIIQKLLNRIILLIIIVLSTGEVSYAQQQDTSKIYQYKDGYIRYYKVEKGKTLYSISKLFNQKQEDILALNPEAENGLKTGMILRIPALSPNGNVASERPSSSLSHTVLPKETVFGIAKKYGLSVEELERMNPEIKEGLKAGSTLIIYPASTKPTKQPDSIQPEKVLLENVPLEKNPCTILSEKNQRRAINITLLLPFYLSPSDELNPKARIGLDFYSGAKLALDSLKKKGYQITIDVFDVQNDSNSIADILKNPVLEKTDLIIGPLYSSSFIKVAEFAKRKGIPAVSPFSQSDALLIDFPNVIKVTPDLISQIDESGPILKKNHPTAKFTLVRNSNEKDKEIADAFKSSLLVSAAIPSDKFQEITYSGIGDIISQLSESDENIIIFPSTVQVQVIDFIGRLSSSRLGKRITLVGLNEWINYENIEFEHLNNLNFSCFTSSSTNYYSLMSKNFQSRFKEEFKGDPTSYSYQGFDVTLYFCNLIAQYGSSFIQCLDVIPQHCGLNSCYRYAKIGEHDGYENHFIYLLEMNNFEMKRKNQP